MKNKAKLFKTQRKRQLSIIGDGDTNNSRSNQISPLPATTTTTSGGIKNESEQQQEQEQKLKQQQQRRDSSTTTSTAAAATTITKRRNKNRIPSSSPASPLPPLLLQQTEYVLNNVMTKLDIVKSHQFSSDGRQQQRFTSSSPTPGPDLLSSLISSKP